MMQMRFLWRSVLPALLCSWVLLAGEAPIPHRDGTLDDLAKLGKNANLAEKAFAGGSLSLDADGLPVSQFVSRGSEPIRLKAGGRYTLVIRYRSEGKGMLMAGVQWVDGKRPAGLAEVEDMRTPLPLAEAWSEETLTFQADAKQNRTRILLKAFGGTRLDVQQVKLVEGWYAD